MHSELCKLYLSAARAAEAMQKQVTSGPHQETSKLWRHDPNKSLSGPKGRYVLQVCNVSALHQLLPDMTCNMQALCCLHRTSSGVF